MVHLLDSGGKRRPKETDERKGVMPFQQRRFLLISIPYRSISILHIDIYRYTI